MKHSSALLFLAMTCAMPVVAEEPTVGQPAPAFSGRDSKGNDVTLASHTGRTVVLEWTNPGCPFVKKHYDSGNMQKLQTTYTEKGVVWQTIASSAQGKQGYYTAEEWNTLITEKSMASTAVVLDADGSIGRAYNAKNTPFMVIVGADGTLLYQGAIDDKSSVEASDIPSSVNHVAAALDEILAGKPVTVSTTQPYGCSVKY